MTNMRSIRQQQNEIPQTFVHRINAHHSKLYAVRNKQTTLSAQERQAQMPLVDMVALQFFLMSLLLSLVLYVRKEHFH